METKIGFSFSDEIINHIIDILVSIFDVHKRVAENALIAFGGLC
jgi:uncharacterized protein YejL (UPF0352 family)